MKTIPFLPALLLPLLTVSCKSTKDSGYEDPYVTNFGNDGSYNPYPDSGYSSQPSYSTPSYETPPVADDYAFTAPSTPAPKPATSTKPKTTTASKPKPAVKKSTASRTHTVVRGDTLYGLARKYGSTVAKIKSANGLSGDLIRIGQKLKIP